MSPKPGSYIIVHLLEDRPAGSEYERSRWPLHMTLIPWFSFGDEAAVRQLLADEARRLSPFDATVGVDELFGPDQTMPVNVLDDQRGVHHLHRELTASLAELGVDFQEAQWMGDRYRAHISHMDGGARRKHQGDKVRIANFCLAQLTGPSTCKILQIYPFGSHETAA